MFNPKKSLGQNFLKNAEIAEKIVEAAKIVPSDFVIEIGPGTGVLTEELAKTGASILAIEKDYSLTTNLRKRYENTKKIKIAHQDILFFDPSTLFGTSPQNSLGASPDRLERNYKVVANIPYNITSPIIRKFLESDLKPESMILMVQKEVAERIVAKPGDSERGLLTLIVEYYADAEILFEVSRNNFYPAPNVDSAVIKLTTDHSPLATNSNLFFKIVKAGFSSKRQQIHNSLSATLRLPKDKINEVLRKAKIDPLLRAEDLSLSDWDRLCQTMTSDSILK